MTFSATSVHEEPGPAVIRMRPALAPMALPSVVGLRFAPPELPFEGSFARANAVPNLPMRSSGRSSAINTAATAK